VRGENMPQGPAAREGHDLEAEQRRHRGQSLGRGKHKCTHTQSINYGSFFN